jgi:hypothetical protein
MLALAVTKLPEDGAWSYELKFDGYRAQREVGRSSPIVPQRQRLHPTLRFDCARVTECQRSRVNKY